MCRSWRRSDRDRIQHARSPHARSRYEGNVMSEPDTNGALEPARCRPRAIAASRSSAASWLEPDGEVEVVDTDPTESITEPGSDAHRIDGEATPRGGPAGAARRSESRAAGGDLRTLDRRGVRRARRQTCRKSCTSLALPFRPDVVPSEAEIRVAKAQLVGGLRGCSTGSRRPCSPSRSRPVSSSRRSASSPAPPAASGARLVSGPDKVTVPAHICSGPEHC